MNTIELEKDSYENKKGIIIMPCVFPHFFHKWKGCKCSRCGKERDQDHKWVDCKCDRCGKIRNQDHQWDGCLCVSCGKIRDQNHEWEKCICVKCKKEKHTILQYYDAQNIFRVKYEKGKNSKLWMDCVCLDCGKLLQEEEMVINSIQRTVNIDEIPTIVLDSLITKVADGLTLESKLTSLKKIALILPKKHKATDRIIFELNKILKSEKKLMDHHDYWASAAEAVRYIEDLLSQLKSR